MPRTLPLAAVATVALALTGCTASANFTVDPDEFAADVATTLQEQVGASVAPTIDCGDESIDIVEDEQVICALSVEGDEAVYDTTATITAVDGADYSYDAEVSDTPRS
ncbi:DUF4333 domain-containing protein [Demequina sp. NBRC 110057]|uniref:DUF4333 domain-containing protein n=1 Tax=Demequina sp. NBRC 110057 TaxID=1570346 RepID=UPI0009FEE2FB|nr:DUF4333 domain-containing protein [Demequina sp. NBRC 110057]